MSKISEKIALMTKNSITNNSSANQTNRSGYKISGNSLYQKMSQKLIRRQKGIEKMINSKKEKMMRTKMMYRRPLEEQQFGYQRRFYEQEKDDFGGIERSERLQSGLNEAQDGGNEGNDDDNDSGGIVEVDVYDMEIVSDLKRPSTVGGLKKPGGGGFMLNIKKIYQGS